MWRKTKIEVPGAVGWAITVLFLNCAFVVFRANDLRSASEVLWAMWIPADIDGFSFNAFAAINVMDKALTALVMFSGIAIVGLKANSRSEETDFRPTWPRLAFMAGLAAVALFFLNGVVSKEFLYFDF